MNIFSIVAVASGLWTLWRLLRNESVLPLSEAPASFDLEGEDGGLYHGGSNELPDAFAPIAAQVSGKIEPLDNDGLPADDGKIGLVGVGASDMGIIWNAWRSRLSEDPDLSPAVKTLAAAGGGLGSLDWGPDGAAWKSLDSQLQAADMTAAQVQIAWAMITLPAPGTEETLAGFVAAYTESYTRLLQAMRRAMPNMRVVFLSSRPYSGYASGELCPEPFSYYTAFAVRALIDLQMDGDEQLALDRVPFLRWGPDLWAHGTSARGDGLSWQPWDFFEDGVHVGGDGEEKAADILDAFFLAGDLAAWLLSPNGEPSPLRYQMSGGDLLRLAQGTWPPPRELVRAHMLARGADDEILATPVEA